MTSDERFSAEIAKEVIQFGKSLWDKRKAARQSVFNERVRPLFEEIKQAHQDFTDVIEGLTKVLRQAELFYSQRVNDDQEFIKDVHAQLEILYEMRHERRSERRLTYEKSKAFRTSLEKVSLTEKAILTEEEKTQLLEFYSRSTEYLSTSDDTYGHQIGGFISKISARFNILQRSSDKKVVLDKILFSKLEIEEYRDELEGKWLEISASYSQVLASHSKAF